MILIAGLGNPADNLKNTRHNIGFRIVDYFQEENCFPDFKFSKKFNAEISKKVIGSQKIILAKPQTYMNNSGESIKSIAKTLRLKPEDIWIIHDDIDILFGKIKISQNRGSAGHKGVESIIKNIKTKNFIRLRIGIKPNNREERVYNLEKFVLQKFNQKEEKALPQAIKDAVLKIKSKLSEKKLN